MLTRFLEKIGLVQEIYGKDGTLYLRRWRLTPRFPFGQLCLHTFFRGDEDKDPHDHPWDFWTFPFTSYIEEVPISAWRGNDTLLVRERMSLRTVERWRWHKRDASHIHRVVVPSNGSPNALDAPDFPFRTLVWLGRFRQHHKWGFWVPDPARPGFRMKIHWKVYLGIKP